MRKITVICILGILLLFVIAVGCKEQAGQAGKKAADAAKAAKGAADASAKKADTSGGAPSEKKAAAKAAAQPAATPIDPVINLHVDFVSCSVIFWAWNYPAGVNYTEIYFNGTLQTSHLEPTNWTQTGLAPNTQGTISVIAHDLQGGISIPVNNTATTLPNC